MQKDLDFFRREYVKQKKLEKIVNSRILLRPNVKKWQVATVFAILPFLLITAIFLPLIIESAMSVRIIALMAVILFVFEIYLRFCLIIVVKYYQHVAKE